jgi:hypothetical protein
VAGGVRRRAPRHAGGGLTGVTGRLAEGWVLLLALFHCSARVTWGPVLV